MVVAEMISRKRLTESTDEEPQTSSDEEQTDEVAEGGNSGWADSIAKVLSTNKPKSKRSLVLSKAKKVSKVQTETKSYNFEIDGEIKEEKPNASALDQVIESKPEKKKQISLRIKPSIADRERDRVLKKVATKGVVQLFNAVRTQQKDLDRQLKEAGPLDHRKDAVLNNINKRKFLDVLMGGDRAKSQLVDNFVKKEEVKDEDDDEEDANGQRQSEWSVLKNDFMTGKKFKNWDKEESDSDGKKGSGGDDDSSDSE